MKKEYILKNLQCPSCINKIETALKKIDNIKSADINFVNTTLTIILKNESEDTEKEIKKVIKMYESDVIVIEKEKIDTNHHDHNDNNSIQLIIGAILFVIGIIIKFLYSNNSIIFLLLLLSYIILGRGVLLKAIKNIIKGQIFDENFLMSIATIGALIIGDITEAVAVMLFYQVGEFFQDLAVKKSKRSISELMNIRPDYANLIIKDNIEKVEPNIVKIGDYIIVKPGEKVPLDCIIIDGKSMIDTSALTGESIPKKVIIGEELISGSVNLSGLLKCIVTKEYAESTVSKIIELVENASSRKSPTENFMTTFSRYYTPVVVLLAFLISTLPPLLFNGLWSSWIHRGLIFLVISCPCALVISIPLSYFGGIGNASRKGILIKGSNYLESLNKLEIVVFDKTGTLTKGLFEVTKINAEKGFTKSYLLETAAKAEIFSTHPIAISILKSYGKEIIKKDIKSYEEMPGYGISVLTDEDHILVGNNKLMIKNNIRIKEIDEIGTKVYVASNNQYIGYIIVSDEIKKDSYRTISELKEKGIKAVMLTGDINEIALSVSKKLGIDEVYSELLPHQKIEMVEKLNKTKSLKGKIAFIGDGVNDAPVLARSDIGVAMGALGSDAAIEASDIVLMTDESSKLIEAINIAKITKKIVIQNIIFALGIKIIFLGLGALGFANMWEAVFADVGVSTIAVFNAMKILRID